MTCGEICGFILRVERKSPGSSDMTRNDSSVIPTSNGIMLISLRTRNRPIRIAPVLLGFELDPLGSVELAPHGRIVVLQRTLPCPVFCYADGFDHRELVMKDFLYPPVVWCAFFRIHHRCSLAHHLIDLRLPRGRRLGLIGIPDV